MQELMAFIDPWRQVCPEWSNEELRAHIAPPTIDEECNVKSRDVEEFRKEISALGKDAFAALLSYCLRLFAKDMVLCASATRSGVVPHWCDNAFARLVSDGNRFNGFIVDIARRLGGEEVARAVGSSSLVCADLASVRDGMVYSLAARMIENAGIELNKNLLSLLELRARRIEAFVCWLMVAFGFEDLAGASRGTLADADKVSLRRFVVAQWNPYDTRFQGDHATPTTAFDAFSKSLTNRFRVRSTDVRNAIFTVSDKGRRQATCSDLKNEPPIQLSEKFLKAHKPFFSREGSTGDPVESAYCLVPRAMVELFQFDHIASIAAVGVINAANPVRLAVQNPCFTTLSAEVWYDMRMFFKTHGQVESMKQASEDFENLRKGCDNAEKRDGRWAENGIKTCFADLAYLRCISFLVRLALCESQAVDITKRARRDGNTPTPPSELSEEDDGSAEEYRSELWLNRLYGGYRNVGEVHIGFARRTNTLTIDGKDTGKRQLIIGRGKSSDIDFDEKFCCGYLSREHIDVFYDGEKDLWFVHDRDSKNGSALRDGEGGWKSLFHWNDPTPIPNGATLVLASTWVEGRREAEPNSNNGLWFEVKIKDHGARQELLERKGLR